MQVVKPSYEILDRRGMRASEKIEQCGRIAYKSEHKIEEGSDAIFCDKMLKNEHFPVLEFSNVHFFIGIDADIDNALVNDHVKHLIQCLFPMKYLVMTSFLLSDRTGIIISGTVRAFMEALSIAVETAQDGSLIHLMVNTIYNSEDSVFPFKMMAKVGHQLHFDYESDIFSCGFITPEEVISMTPYYEDHLMCAVKFIVNRAVTHELVRHRPSSYLQESQRYCRYSAERFGKEVTFIAPTAFFEEGSTEWEEWEAAMLDAEESYMTLLQTSSPQAARTVLPNSCKTEIIVYTTITEWRHIEAMRTSGAAEPSMREVMVPLFGEFYEHAELWE